MQTILNRMFKRYFKNTCNKSFFTFLYNPIKLWSVFVEIEITIWYGIANLRIMLYYICLLSSSSSFSPLLLLLLLLFLVLVVVTTMLVESWGRGNSKNYYTNILPSQIVLFPLQTPVGRHCLFTEPPSRKPGSQEKRIAFGNTVNVPYDEPFKGTGGGPQSTADT